MNGAHDLGGMHGFGAVDRSQVEHFPTEWEKKVFQLTLACGMQGRWNLDQARFARETMEPAHYLSSSYYEHWLHGLEVLLAQSGLADAPPGAYTPVLREQVAGILGKGGPTLMDATMPAGYRIGDQVRIASRHPKTHTRMPRYIRGRVGKVVLYHGAHVFPDQHARDGSKVPAHLYTVRFTGDELWGAGCAEPHSSVSVDVFEPYIDGCA